jgi:hypothetical protein
VTQGGSALFAVEVDAVGGSASTDTIKVAITCGTIPTGATCTLPESSVTVSPGTSASVSFTVSTTAATANAPPRFRPNFRTPLGRLLVAFYMFTLLAFLGFYRWSRKHADALGVRRPRWAGAMLFAILLTGVTGAVSGCGSANVINPGPTGTTLPGTYNLSFTGAAGNDTHTLVVTLVVQ